MLYSVGDIHGRFDLLKILHRKIMEHSKQFDEIHTIVTLGDYIDRGSQSKEVIDFLWSEPFDGFKHIFLRGNHEDMMAKSLYVNSDIVTYHHYQQDIRTARDIFLGNGGDSTLKSFGVENPAALLYDKDSLDDIFKPYAKWFGGLRDYYVANGYLFVHAGIDPGIALEEQNPNVMYWIRDKFLNSELDHGYMVIHGHTPTTMRGCGTQVEFKPNRINIDTCAYRTNVLTAVCLDEAHERRPEILNTHPDG